MKLLIGILTFNCASKVSLLTKEVHKFNDLDFSSLGINHEIHFFDDGSSDNTVEQLKSNFASDIITSKKKNAGYGANVKGAMRYADTKGFDFLVIFPGDMQRRSQDVFKLCKKIVTEGSDVVVGEPDLNRILGKVPLGRRIGRHLINYLTGLLWNHQIGDSLSGFKIYRVKKCREIFWLCQDRFGYDLDFSFWSHMHGMKMTSIKTFVSYDNHLSTINSTFLQGFNFVVRVVILGLLQRPIIWILQTSILNRK